MLVYFLAFFLLFQPAFLSAECTVSLEFFYNFRGTDEIRVVTASAEKLNFIGQKVEMKYTREPTKENGLLNWSIIGDGTLEITYGISSERYELKDFRGNLSDVPEKIREKYTGKGYLNIGGETIKFIDPGNMKIKKKALEIAGEEQNIYQISKMLYDWITENIDYNGRAGLYPQNAAETLRKKSGDCDEQTALFLSLARSLGVPCFYIDGYVIDGEGKYPAGHAWSGVIKYCDNMEEVFPVDTVCREFGIKRANKVFVDFDNGKEGYMGCIYADIHYWYGKDTEPEIEYEVTCTDFTSGSSA